MGQYDDLFDDPIKPAATYDDLFDETPKANLALRFGIETNPDQAAEAARLARRYRLPVGVVKEFREDYVAKAKADDAKAVVDQSPVLQSWIAKDQQNADISHDDVGNLSAVAAAVRMAGAFGEGIVGQGGAGSVLTGASKINDIAARGIGSVLSAIGGDGVKAALETEIPWWLDPTKLLLDRPGQALKDIGRSMAPDNKLFREDVAGGLGQFAGQALTTVVTGGAGAFPAFFAQGVDAMSERVANDPGSQGAKDSATLIGAGVTAVTEKYAIDKILGPMAVPIKGAITSALARIGIGAATEGAQEMAESIGQDVVRMLLTDPDAKIDALQTTYEGGVGAAVGGIARSIVEATLHVKRRGDARAVKAGEAESTQEALKNLDELAKVSKVRERDADTFEQFVEHAAEDGPVRDVYISGEVLMQSGMLDKLAQVSPSIAEQAQDAAATGGDVRIPIAEYAGRIAGTDLSGALLQHLKTSENGLSQAEAKEYIKDQGERLKADVARQLGESAQGAEMMAGRDAVQAQVLEKLSSTQRFTPDVNSVYAAQMANFFAIQSKRAGTTPEALYKQYEPRIVAESVDGPSLAQDTETPAFRNWFGDSKVVDDAGKPLVVYHGTTSDFSQFDPKKTRDIGIHFGTQQQAGALGGKLMPVHLSIKNPIRLEDVFSRRDGLGKAWNDIHYETDITPAEDEALLGYAKKVQDKWSDDRDVDNTSIPEFKRFWKLVGKILKRSGYDGIVYENEVEGAGDSYVAFEPAQIKSTNNRGTFDPNDPNILNQDAQSPELEALQAISQNDEMFSLPKSDKKTLPEIAAENMPGIEVGKAAHINANEVMYTLTMPDGGQALITVRKPNKDANYGADFDAEKQQYRMDMKRPGRGEVDPKAEDVWIDVSRLKEGGRGNVVYNIAATFAHNTGRIFIGDPSGVSDAAMKRRPENMLSSALKFGTTKHLAPHPDQVRGKGGVPPLDWVYGDDIGNVRKLIELNLKINENAGNESLLVFDPGAGFRTKDGRPVRLDEKTGRFTDQEGRGLDGGAVSPAQRGGQRRSGDAGERTIARGAVFRALLREEGQEGEGAGRDGGSVLAQLVRVGRELPAVFYQGGVKPNATFSPATNTIALLKGANLTSFLHESGHFYLEVLTDLARTVPAIRQDVDATLKWFGITGSETVQPGERPGTLNQDDDVQPDAFVDAKSLRPINAVEDKNKEKALVSSIASRGWVGRPLLVWKKSAGKNQALTGSHRLSAAKKTGVSVPVVYVSDAVNVWEDDSGLFGTFQEAIDDQRVGAFLRAAGDERAAKLANEEDFAPAIFAQDGTAPETTGDLPPGRTPFETWELMTLEQRRPYHEMWARGFEAYLFEGKSPSLEMGSIFARFRAWMLDAYKSIKALRVELTPEVRGVFDRMLATPDQIEAAEASREMGLMFATEEEARKFGVDWAEYQAKGQKATEQAVSELDKKSLADMQWLSNAKARILKEMQKRNDGIRKEVEREVRAEVMNRPVYKAWSLLTAKEGEAVRAADDADAVAVGRAKLNTEELKETYGVAPDAPWRKLSALKMTSAADGVSPESIAEQIGFTSGDEMVQALIDAVPPKEVIQAQTDQTMLERYGDITSDEALSKAVDEAVHNDMRQKVVADELAALEKAESQTEETGKTVTTKNKAGEKVTRAQRVRTLPKAAREFAQNLIAGLKVRDLRPGQYATAAARAGVMAMRALKKNNIAEAAKQKRNQLIQGYAAKAATQAQAEIDLGLDYLRRVEGSKSLDPDYRDQIDTILERFDLKRGTSLKTIEKRQALSEWIAQQEELGVSPDLPANVRNEALRKSYKDMTVEEFRGLIDSVKQIEHLGRLKKKLLTAKDKRDFEAVKDELVASIDSNATKKVDNRTRDTLTSGAMRLFKGYFASHRKTASLAKELDGFKDGGPMWEYFVRTMNEAGDTEAVMREQATIKLTKILKPILTGEKLTGKGKFFSSVGISLNRGERITMALNVGNAGNMQRLLDGRGWNLQQIQPVLDTLTESDWQAVQSVWDFFEGYRPQIAAKERRVMGKEPDWVEPVPVVTKFGTLKGGYYPVLYDPRESGRAENFANAEDAKMQLKGAFVASTTRRSFTKSRADEVKGRPVLLTMDGVFRGANEVIHDLSWHEWVIDANRILRNDDVDKSIRDGYGAETASSLKQAVKDIAAGEAGTVDALSKVLNPLRTGAVVAGLGFNLTNALLQPLGLTQSMVRVGSRWVALGIGEWAKSPVGLVKRVHEKSDFMRLRAKTQQRELNEIQSVVKGKSAVRAKIDALMFTPMTGMQLVADMPTWWGAYQKALANGDIEERAVEMADQAVIDAQGGGQMKDLSAIQRGGPLLKLFTAFYGFFNVSYNLGIERAKATNYRDPLQIMHLAWDFLLLYSAPAVLATLIKEAVVPGDDDEEEMGKKIIGDQLSFLMGQMVGMRELTGAFQFATGTKQFNQSYGGPAGLRFVQEMDKLGKQIGQGDLDRALVRAGVNVGGVVLHLPSGQINRTIDGVLAVSEGRTEDYRAVFFGAPPK